MDDKLKELITEYLGNELELKALDRAAMNLENQRSAVRSNRDGLSKRLQNKMAYNTLYVVDGVGISLVSSEDCNTKYIEVHKTEVL